MCRGRVQTVETPLHISHRWRLVRSLTTTTTQPQETRGTLIEISSAEFRFMNNGLLKVDCPQMLRK